MNWGRVKTVLIFLFLCADLFLLAIYFTSIHSSSVISQDVINSTVSVLENNNISIEASVIPKKMPKIPYVEAENVISDQKVFAQMILGNDITAIDYGYESDMGKLTFFGDRFNFQAESFVTSWLGTPITSRDISQKKLESLGFDLSNADITTTKTDVGFSVTFTNHADSLPIFNSQVTVTLAGDIITSISGVWFNETEAVSGNNLKNITAALIDFIPDAPQGITITELEPGYDIFDKEAYHKSAALIPVWKATCSDGSVYYLDARNMQY